MNPVKLKNVLEELGPTFIKIGQILSNRPDLLSGEYVNELGKLRNEVNPMSYQEVLDILNEEYDKNLFQLFLSIERNPLGSASIAQVHKAILKDGTDVVIKVQRRNIKEIMVTDIKLLKKALKMLHVEKMLHNIVSFDDILDELLNITLEEMNFLIEAEHINEFYDANKEIVYVKVPKVVKRLTTERVLVMEHICGTDIYEIDKLKEEGYFVDEIGNKLADNFIYQALDIGFFHADLHPNNIIIADGKISYIDYGMMGRLNNRNKELLKKCMVAIFNNEIKEVERILLVLCDVTGEVDHIKLCKELELILDKNKTVGIKDINITKFANELINILGKYGIKMPKDITMLVRGIVVLEGTLEVICPDISLMKVFENKVKQGTLKNLLDNDNLVKEAGHFITSLGSMNRIPYDLHTLLKSTNRGDTKINIEITDSNKYLDRFEKMVHRVVVCILDVSFIVGAAIMVSNGIETNEQKFLFYLFFIVGFLLTIWLFIKMYIDKLNRKK
jgi:ubiquinone biosynthesis protein